MQQLSVNKQAKMQLHNNYLKSKKSLVHITVHNDNTGNNIFNCIDDLWDWK